MLHHHPSSKLMPIGKHISKLREDVEFLRGWIREPGEVGAVKPTGQIAASAMASVIETGMALPVLELGPGTGVITRAILDRGVAPENLISIEYSHEFYIYLKDRFPKVQFLNKDAFDLATTLGEAGFGEMQFGATISAIPLLLVDRNRAGDLISDCLERMAPGRPFVQICYGPKPPVAAQPGRFTVRHLDTVLRNLPPARLWVYSSTVD